MSVPRIVVKGNRYVLTDEGRSALQVAEVCDCKPQVEGGLLVCPVCLTVYATLRQFGFGLTRADSKRP